MLRPAVVLLAEGRALARDCRVGRNVFLDRAGVATEAEYKRRTVAAGRIMQHAHIGFRSIERTCEAMAEVHRACAARGVTVDRFGVTLDWSMGYPAGMRADRPRGTGIVLGGPDDFRRIANAAPKAMVFNVMTTKIALGAVVMRAPSVTDFDRDPLTVIETGDWVKVDGDRGIVEIIKKAI